VFLVATGGCGSADGTVLRIFPSGGWIRVTAFNLEQPASGNVVNATYRVSVPALENLVESNPARLLFPDPLVSDLHVDCGPHRGKEGGGSSGGIPVPPGVSGGPVPPGAKPPPPTAPPPAATAVPAASGSPKGGPPAKPPATPQESNLDSKPSHRRARSHRPTSHRQAHRR
jgi:hypothetical protein